VGIEVGMGNVECGCILKGTGGLDDLLSSSQKGTKKKKKKSLFQL
jgi:hypothetical protein